MLGEINHDLISEKIYISIDSTNTDTYLYMHLHLIKNFNKKKPLHSFIFRNSEIELTKKK